MKSNNDNIVTLKGEPDICATLDFSTKYIRDKRYGRFPIKKEAILMYSWTDDKYRNINIDIIKNIKPLSDILRNESNEERHKSW